jgi:hypothetical protein
MNGKLLRLAAVLTAVLGWTSDPTQALAAANAARGSPAATTSIDGKQLPPPPPKFGGVIEETAKDSKPLWRPRVVPPKGAPNVLLIMTDDQGYGVCSTFGGVIPTPALDRIAKAGLRYTQFHSTALCSPTRAALITGRNHHSAGFGIISEQSTGFPGYDSVIGTECATVGRILRDHGYATSWFGKNHNTPSYQYGVAGPFHQWPVGMRTVFTYSGEMGGIPPSDSPSILNRSYNITAEVEVAPGGAEGMLVTEGGRFGGYGLYLLKGKPVFLYNFVGLEKTRWEGSNALTPGKHTIVFDFKYDGPGFGKGGTGILTVDGKEAANQKIAHTTAFLITVDETFDVGMDTRTPVDDKDYHVPFRFTGTIARLQIELQPLPGGLEPTGRPKEKSELNPTQDKLQVSTLPKDGVSMSESERALYQRMMQWWALNN